MRKYSVVPLFALATVLFIPSHTYGQIWGGQDAAAVDQPPPGGKASTTASGAFERHDFTGVWQTDHRGTNGYRGMTTEEGIPARTPWAEALFKSRLTGRESKEKAGVPPAFGNDPIMECNPYGFPRMTRRTLKPGDQIKLTLFPSKAGTRVGVVTKIERDGQVIMNDREAQ